MDQRNFTNITRKVKKKHIKREDRIKIENLERANHLLPKKKQMTRKEMDEVVNCSISSLYRELRRRNPVQIFNKYLSKVHKKIVQEKDYRFNLQSKKISINQV